MKKLHTKENKNECLERLKKINGYAFTRLARTFALRRPMSLKVTHSIFAPQERAYGFSFEGTISESARGSVIEGKTKTLKRTWLAHCVIAAAAIISLILWFKFSPPFNDILFEAVLHLSVILLTFLSIFIRFKFFDARVRRDLADAFGSDWEKV